TCSRGACATHTTYCRR
ncbi:regulatory protein luxO, partial [Vibrio parahaemolyticus EKP-008]